MGGTSLVFDGSPDAWELFDASLMAPYRYPLDSPVSNTSVVVLAARNSFSASRGMPRVFENIHHITHCLVLVLDAQPFAEIAIELWSILARLLRQCTQKVNAFIQPFRQELLKLAQLFQASTIDW